MSAEEAPAADGAVVEEKKKRGKPKDEHAPPKPKNPYSRFAGEKRKEFKETRPELICDLSALGKAMAEEWAKVPEEEKARSQEIYDKEMVIWKPLWHEYKQTGHYKEEAAEAKRARTSGDGLLDSLGVADTISVGAGDVEPVSELTKEEFIAEDAKWYTDRGYEAPRPDLAENAWRHYQHMLGKHTGVDPQLAQEEDSLQEARIIAEQAEDPLKVAEESTNSQR